MARAVSVVFTELSANDFFKINSANLARGGGQSYIDFPTSAIRPADWEAFLDGKHRAVSAKGWPYWRFSVHSLGTGLVQHEIELGQRRLQSFNIRSQKLPEISREGRRIHAWRPANGFPALSTDAEEAGLVQVPPGLRVFLVRDDQGEIWAGWTLGEPPPEAAGTELARLFKDDAGYIPLATRFELDISDVRWPFRRTPVAAAAPDAAQPAGGVTGGAITGTASDPQAEQPQVRLDLWDPADEAGDGEAFGYKTQKVRERNRAAVDALKALYKACQVTGTQYVFNTAKGAPYLEVHHLVPLGLGGADKVSNMVVVSAHVHRLLHYADVEGLDLEKIVDGKLDIRINGEPFTITWHPQHAAVVSGALNPSAAA